MKKIILLPIMLIVFFIGGAIALSMLDMASEQTQTKKEIQIDIQ